MTVSTEPKPVEVSSLTGMLAKYEEDFVLCSKIDEAMDFFLNSKFLKSSYI